MTDIQIYYLLPNQLIKGLKYMNIDLNLILRQGDKTITEVNNEIKLNPNYCRDEFGIDLSHFKGLINSDISLYATINGEIAGLLTFMFNMYQNKRIILLNGVCSPDDYSRMGVGKKLIDTLIQIGKTFNINYIKLECKGDRLMNYYKKFGFAVTSSKSMYDSDDDSDDENSGHPYYRMELDLSKVAGGKKRRRTIKKKRTAIKRKSKRENRKKTRRN